ncbi:MAG TPA: hypothetical protein VF331_13950 [Polyangiales bacterium]
MTSEPACQPFAGKQHRAWFPRPGEQPKDWAVRPSTASVPPSDWLEKDPSSVVLQRKLAPIEAAISDSRSIVQLLRGWDDEDAEPISETTWRKAAAFLRRTAAIVLARCSVALAAPKISPCSNGSIDMLWQTPRFKLLINIPPIDGEHWDVFGERKSGFTISGRIDPENGRLGLLLWLLETHKS